MKIKERLKLMKEIEARNRKRIKVFTAEARKGPLKGSSEKAGEYRGDSRKHE